MCFKKFQHEGFTLVELIVVITVISVLASVVFIAVDPARQAVAHGHFLVNGKKVYVPSFAVKEGDRISVREGSRNSKLFNEIEGKLSSITLPDWLVWDPKNKELAVKSGNFKGTADLLFDLGQVIEYYQR
jgi:small subunit ribosomal protein S4